MDCRIVGSILVWVLPETLSQQTLQDLEEQSLKLTSNMDISSIALSFERALNADGYWWGNLNATLSSLRFPVVFLVPENAPNRRKTILSIKGRVDDKAVVLDKLDELNGSASAAS